VTERIAIFDFDGTLFRSPERPEWWPHQGFWGRLETLSPPYVPERPSAEWYVGTVVAAAKAALSDPKAHACLLTGRIPKFEKRVRELLANVGIRFDEMHFAAGSSTLPFKLGIIERLAEKFPEATTIEMWEDRQEHIGSFEQKIKSLGREPLVHHIKSTPHEFLEDRASKVASRFLTER